MHFLSDVIAGCLIGAGLGYGSFPAVSLAPVLAIREGADHGESCAVAQALMFGTRCTICRSKVHSACLLLAGHPAKRVGCPP